MKIYDHGLPPLLMQNPYSKFLLAIKTLSVDRFLKFLQVLMRQIEIWMQTRNTFDALQQKKILLKN